MLKQELSISPRLLALQQSITSGAFNTLDSFWQEITDRGIPLIEALPNDPDYSLVTFLCRVPEHIKQVWLSSELCQVPANEIPLIRLSSTNLWYITYRVRNDLRTPYYFILDNTVQVDPCNPLMKVWPSDEDSLNTQEYRASVLELPQAPSLHLLQSQTGVAVGRLEHLRLSSQRLCNERPMSIYTPARYTTDGMPYDLLLLFDRSEYVNVMPTSVLLDNLIAERELRPLVAILIGHPNIAVRNRELFLDDSFIEFMAEECLLWIRSRYHVTNDPARIVIGGLSAGGLTAAYAGLRYPYLFGNVLAQSGGFVMNRNEDEEYEWLARQFANSSCLPLRFHIDVGLLETVNNPASGIWPYMLLANRHMRTILQAKGYSVHYVEFNGGHNALGWQSTLADGLKALIGIRNC